MRNNINKSKMLSLMLATFFSIGLLSGCSDSTTKTKMEQAKTTTEDKKDKGKDKDDIFQDSSKDSAKDNSSTGAAVASPATDNNTSNSNSNSGTKKDSAAASGNTNNTQKQTQTATNNSVEADGNRTVYYVEGSKVYHYSKSDGTLKKSKNILSMTEKEAKANGMRPSQAKTDQH